MSGYYFGENVKRIFDLLIYRFDEATYWSEQKADRDAYVLSYDLDPNSKSHHVVALKQHWFERYGGPWQFNEVVGGLAVFAAPGKIGGLLYITDRRITKRMTHKRFFLKGNVFFEFNVWPEDTRFTCLCRSTSKTTSRSAHTFDGA